MPKSALKNSIIRSMRRLTVVVAATAIILAYIYLLNYFGGIFGAGQGWDNPLSWFASAVLALIAVFCFCWLLTKIGQWLTSKFKSR